MHQKKYARIMALIVSISMIAGIMIGIFVIWPLLLPFLVAAGAAIFIYSRYFRGKRGK